MKKLAVIILLLAVIISPVFSQDCASPVTRTIKKGLNNDFVIDVFVKLSKIDSLDRSFSRLIEELPEGATCNVIDGVNADISIKNDKLKLVWLQMPQEDFHVKYELIFNQLPENLILNGTYSVLLKGNNKKAIKVEECK